MALRDGINLSIVEAHVKSVETHRLHLILENLVREGVHQDHVYFAKGVPSLQRHDVVEGLRE